jgi:hypothetical protein
MKLRKVRLDVQLVHMAETKKNAYTILVKKSQEKRPFGGTG